MEFVFDPNKSESNRSKHGIDFADAQKLWDDPARVLVPARTSDEPRYVLIGEGYQISFGPPYSRSVMTPYGSSPFGDPGRRRLNYMKAKEFDKKFDAGESIAQHLDLNHAVRPGQEQKRVNVDFPAWMVSRLDKEAKRLGVPRQSLIKVWIAEKLQSLQF